MRGGERALLIYDGACAFCRLWADHWRAEVGARVHFATSQDIAATLPDVPRERYANAVQLIDEDGSRYQGAAAVFRLLSKRPGSAWIAKLYDAPAVAPVSERAYRLVARHRGFFLKLTHSLWGTRIQKPRYGLAARLFLQALAVIYFIAFLSLFYELPGLVGPRGILPTPLPAPVLQGAALLGASAALLALGGALLVPCFLLLWALYLFLAVMGRGFSGFSWDLLLLEVGFLAIFLLPLRSTFAARLLPAPSTTVIWLFRFLLFRFFFSQGLAKLFSDDPAWRTLSGMAQHLEMQWLPAALAWFAHALPVLLLKGMALATVLFELFAPLLFFLPRRARFAGAALLAGQQLLALLTGHAAFLPWLLLALCLFLLDDSLIERVYPRLRMRASPPAAEPAPWRHRTVRVVAVLVVTCGLTRLFVPLLPLPFSAEGITAAAGPFGISNAYATSGPLPAMRTEIIIEGSSDGFVWKEYALRQKPGDVKRAPPLFGLSPARLDARLALAAREPETQLWISQLLLRLVQDSEPVTALFETNPFPDAPPAYVRATLYTYRFTSPTERARDGAWWRREMRDAYLPTISLVSPAVP